MPRPKNKYKPIKCAASGGARCKDLNKWGTAWHNWGKELLKEIDELRQAVCDLEKQVYYGVIINKGSICDARGPISKGGTPPTDTTQPPKPPFKP